MPKSNKNNDFQKTSIVKDPENKYFHLNQERDEIVNDFLKKRANGEVEDLPWRQKRIQFILSFEINSYLGNVTKWGWFVIRHGWYKTFKNWMLVKTYVANNDPAKFAHANWEMILQRACLADWRKKFDKSLIDYQNTSQKELEKEIESLLIEGEGMKIYPTLQWQGGAFLLQGFEEEEKLKLKDLGGITYYFEKYGFEVVKNNFLLFKPLLTYDGIHILKFLPLSWWNEWWLEDNFYQIMLDDEEKFLKKNKKLIEKEIETPLFPYLKD